MLTVLVVTIAGIVIGGLVGIDEGGCLSGMIGGLILGVMFGFAIAGLVSSVGPSRPNDNLVDTKLEEQAIVSLKDEMSVSGGFVLGSGSIDSNPQYVYFYEKQPGIFQQDWVDSENTVLVEDASVETAHLTTVKETYASECDAWCIGDDAETTFTRYELHVPAGTLVRQMQVG